MALRSPSQWGNRQGSGTPDVPAHRADRTSGLEGTPPPDPVDGDRVVARTPAAAPPERLIVIGGGHVGRTLAERLATHGPAHHLDADPDAVEAATDAPHAATHVDDVTVPDAIAALSPTADDLAVVVTGHDGRNLLVAQHLRAAGAGRVLVVPTDPRNEELFDLPGVATLSRGSALAAAVRAHAALDGTPREPTADPAGDRPASG